MCLLFPHESSARLDSSNVNARRDRDRAILASIRRDGLSLMEVMFAIGVVMIGLLGVAVLIPVAGKLASDAQTLDHASRVGMNACREFQILAMSDWETWRHPLFNYDTKDNDGDGRVDEYDEIVPPRRGFVIDPQFYAKNVSVSPPAGNNGVFFPYVNAVGTEPRLVRMTLANSRTKGAGMMQGEQAERIFVSADDLLIALPHDPLEPAQQSGAFDPNLGLQPTSPPGPNASYYGQRQYEGRMSWIATLAPKNDTNPNTPGETFILSIVVFKQRDREFKFDKYNEQVGKILFSTGFPGGGVSGGDVEIIPRSSSFEPNSIKRGSWVMLARNSPAGPHFRWYKVLEVDAEDDNVTTPSVGSPPLVAKYNATLFGPDWTADPQNDTFVFIMPGTISVYEKTIRIENSSLWKQ